MIELYKHQEEGIEFLRSRRSAMLADEMGLGKTRQALMAALRLFDVKKIDRVIVLAPAAVAYSWREEIVKLKGTSNDPTGVSACFDFTQITYDVKKQKFFSADGYRNAMPITIISYALLPQERHVRALSEWCLDGLALLVCDESSFLKNRSAKQTRGAVKLAENCVYCWLLTGTPVANSPLDLYAQAQVMSRNDGGPFRYFKNFYAFRNRYAVMGGYRVHGRPVQVVGYQNLSEMTKKFASHVLRREKKDCLDLPPKTYETREVALDEKTWKIYQELRREALLALPDEEVKPEGNAAVRLLRLCQLTSGHVGGILEASDELTSDELTACEKDSSFRDYQMKDISSEKLDWLVSEIVDGELSSEHALIVWCRWRRERQRLAEMLRQQKTFVPTVYELYGGQTQASREENIELFQKDKTRRVLLAQPHAGGFGLNLTAASTAVYLSNDFSYTTRIQSEDRCHRIGQRNAVTYVDIIATGPRGQRTVDAYVLDCLRKKNDLAALTCAAWRKVLSDE
jgi:SNF2 family DNA or RNA helicase